MALTWAASTGATSYTVKRSTTMGSGYTDVQTGVTGTSFTNTGADQRHHLLLRGHRRERRRRQRQLERGQRHPDCPAAGRPGQPDRHRGQHPGQPQPGPPASGATSYTVKRSLTTGGPYTDFTQSGITGTSYIDTGLTNGTTYYYVVTASNASGESGNSNQASATPQPPPPPPPPAV